MGNNVSKTTLEDDIENEFNTSVRNSISNTCSTNVSATNTIDLSGSSNITIRGLSQENYYKNVCMMKTLLKSATTGELNLSKVNTSLNNVPMINEVRIINGSEQVLTDINQVNDIYTESVMNGFTDLASSVDVDLSLFNKSEEEQTAIGFDSTLIIVIIIAVIFGVGLYFLYPFLKGAKIFSKVLK
jgi:hypothetical protein